ncbi:MAG: 5-deoxy-glucuronate isomerase [Acidobacteriia bacterium]|nr:5-deoxy-glucuronate isomerase [Terriglobia bacterium]
MSKQRAVPAFDNPLQQPATELGRAPFCAPLQRSSLLVKPLLPPASGGEIVSITQEACGWDSISLRVVRLEKDQTHRHVSAQEEMVLLMLGGKASVRTGTEYWPGIGGRAHVFDGMPHALYLPAGTQGITLQALTEGGCEVAICGARATRQFPSKVILPSAVDIEVRGGGNATRQINHIVKPEFPADRILVVEVYTPSGNWSSYPPHKHDVHNPPGEVDLDEIYYYRIAKPDAQRAAEQAPLCAYSSEGYAIQRVYTRDGQRDATITVRDNEVILIPDGYHPVVAAHGYDCYYLNVLAGSARSMAASDDPDYAWVRGEWRDKDPRVPLVKGPQ